MLRRPLKIATRIAAGWVVWTRTLTHFVRRSDRSEGFFGTT
jgi:hypothetical protein